MLLEPHLRSSHSFGLRSQKSSFTHVLPACSYHQVLQHPVASQAVRDLTLVRGRSQSQNTYSLYSLECIVRRATSSMNGSPPCDSDRLLVQHCCVSPPLSYERWRLSKLRAHHLPPCAVTSTWTCDDLAWKEEAGQTKLVSLVW
jgi:hypothetical protein